MAIDPQLLEQVLRTPASRDVTESPIVRAVILGDPSNAADLVPALAEAGTERAHNARRVLCMFDAPAVPFLLAAARSTDPTTRKEVVEIMWAMLVGEDQSTIREALASNATDLHGLLDDKRPLPDTMPDYIERDFEGRICDLAYGVLQYLTNMKYDQSLFRTMDDRGRDDEIKRLKARGFGLQIV